MKKISRLRGVKQKHGLKYMFDNLKTVPERKNKISDEVGKW